MPNKYKRKTPVWRSDPLIQRLFYRTRITESDCWEWEGSISKTRGGYGEIWVDKRIKRVHRVGYELLVGPIPEGLQIDHLCRNVKCWNPSHLEAVTGRVNYLRGIGPSAQNARKTHCVKGHEFTPENTYVRLPNSEHPQRACRACRDETCREGRRAKRDPSSSRRINKTAQCPACRGWYVTRSDGSVRKHPATRQGLSTTCEGSGHHPRVEPE